MIILFCQAPLEVNGTLQKYVQYENSNESIIIICHIEALYQFFRSLELKNVVVLLFKAVGFRNEFDIKGIYKYRKLIRQNCKEVLKYKKENESVKFVIGSRLDKTVVTYIHYLDIAPGLIEYCTICDLPSDFSNLMPNTLRMRIKKYMLEKICFGRINYSVREQPWTEFVELPDCVRFEKLSESESINKRFSAKIPMPNTVSKPMAIVFTEPYRNTYQSKKNYDDLNVRLVNFLKAEGYYVVMKGHPRIGIHPMLENVVDYVIPNYVPSQYLDLSMFKCAIGFVSTALISAAKILPTFSLLDMSDIEDTEQYEFWKNFFKDSNVYFVHEFLEIVG